MSGGNSMVIYEVNLKINGDIFLGFTRWLRQHVEKILTYPGFIKAVYLKDQKEISPEIETLSIQYYVDSLASLDDYLTNHASEMRNDGLVKFPGKFSATRRILNIEEEIILSN